MADSRDVRSGADFDANQTLDCAQPLLQALVLQRRASVHPAPVAEHQNVRAGEGAAVPAMGQFVEQKAVGGVDFGLKRVGWPDLFAAAGGALQVMD